VDRRDQAVYRKRYKKYQETCLHAIRAESESLGVQRKHGQHEKERPSRKSKLTGYPQQQKSG
jgi:hypothetical protein